jgi:hypothetical protein
MSKVKVVLNEQHKLMNDQVKILDAQFGEEKWEIFLVPKNGWNLEEMKEIAEKLVTGTTCYGESVVFASPIPALMALIAEGVSKCSSEHGETGYTWWVPFFVLHNDRREKKELPNGKVIMTVAKEGWMIV